MIIVIIFTIIIIIIIFINIIIRVFDPRGTGGLLLGR